MKRIAICMDGTWQTIRQERPTNVGVIARSIAHTVKTPGQPDVPQTVIYTQGVGSTVGALDKSYSSGINGLVSTMGQFVGGAFGDGLEDSILDTYLRLSFNYEPEDEIYIFGFSRGAFSARSLAALIGKCGIISRRYAEKVGEAFDLYRDKNTRAQDPGAVEFRRAYGKRVFDAAGQQIDYRPKIKYLGIFDTVGQRGLPSVFGGITDMANSRFAFHDLDLGAHVQAARHALAIDERRRVFPPTRWTNLPALNEQAIKDGRGEMYFERWFSGCHGDVGGGEKSTLPSFALEWIIDGAEQAGLMFDRSLDSPLGASLATRNPWDTIIEAKFLSSLHPVNWRGKWRTVDTADGDPTLEYCDALVASSVAARAAMPGKRRYAPPPLRRLLPKLGERAVALSLTLELLRIATAEPKRKKGMLTWFKPKPRAPKLAEAA